MQTIERDLKRRIVDVFKYMDEKGLNYGRSGNISVKVGDDRLLITPSGVIKSALSPEDILLVSMNGEVIEGRHKPSVEMPLHLAIYKSYSHVGAIIHAHPVYTSILAVIREPLPPIIEEMMLYTGGEVRVADYAPFGTEELAENAVKALKDRSAVILANHGVVTCGRNLDEALEVLVVVERTSQIYVLAKLTGKVYSLPEEIVDYYKSLFAKKIIGQ